jgi:hypothetical protein
MARDACPNRCVLLRSHYSDKGGRVINVGGWSLDSTFGIRLYTPDGSAGVNATHDWEEDFQELSLQVGK